jgi:hypothetical protein
MSAGAFSAALLALYAGVGIVCAVAARHHALGSGRRDWGELVFAFAVWPLWLPLWLGAHPAAAAAAGGGPRPLRDAHPATSSLLAALARVQGSPLAPLLPDPASVHRLAAKLTEASRQIEELDEVLARPTFDLPAALARSDELAHEGSAISPEARASAVIRVQNIERLRDLRARFVAEVDEIDELLSQLVIQVEVVRFVGAAQTDQDDGLRDLLAELLARVEGLGQMLDDRPALRLTGA